MVYPRLVVLPSQVIVMKYKKIILAIGVALLSGQLQAQIYRSSFGFETIMTENWLIVSRDTVRDNPELLNFNATEMQGFDSSLKTKVQEMALSGRFELLYYRKSDNDFNDNINLFVSNPARTDLALALGSLCQNLQAQLQQAYNRVDFTSVHSCEFTNIALVEMLAYAFDGAIIGSRSYGYIFNTRAGTVTMTVTCKLAKCEEVKADAERLFLEIRL